MSNFTPKLPLWIPRRLTSRNGKLLFEAAFFTLVASVCLPLWVTKRLPLQDLPQHLATLRVLHDYGNSSLGFGEIFQIDYLRTQYLSFYILAWPLTSLFGVIYAAKLLLSASVIALPYALRAVLRALGSCEAYAILCLPLVYNGQFILGFFNFILALPLLFWGLALAIEQRRSWSSPRAIASAAVLLICFYSHVVPCLVLSCGTLLLSIGTARHHILRSLAGFCPTLIAAAFWARSSPAGIISTQLVTTRAAEAQFQSWSAAFAEIPSWLSDVFYDEWSERILILWAGLCFLILVWGAQPCSSKTSPAPRICLTLLCVFCGLAYFMAPVSYAWIWPIHARFILLSALLLICILPAYGANANGLTSVGLIRLRNAGSAANAGILLLAAGLTIVSSQRAAHAFKQVERDEFVGLDTALAAIPPAQKVVGLVWDRGSRYVKYSPFIHCVAWYQAEKGGAVQFSFATFPQSPVLYKPGKAPTPLAPRWEWTPGSVDPVRDLGYFDYVLTRGGPGAIARLPQHWQLLVQSGSFAVWRRITPPA